MLTSKIRRIITMERDGKSSVMVDDVVTATEASPMVEIWNTDSAPVKFTQELAPDLLAQLEPPETGSFLRHVIIMPQGGNGGGDQGASERFRKIMTQYGGNHTLTEKEGSHWGMHRTKSLDYLIVLSGKATLILDDREVEVGPFDVVVQQGIRHAWVNRGTEPFVMIGVALGAKFSD